jgi:hypothetical protein
MTKIPLAALLNGMTIEQRILTVWFYSQFDNNSGANKKIVNVEYLYIMDGFGGAALQLLNYAANILYLCLEFSMVGTDFSDLVPSFCGIYDENNIQVYNLTNGVISFDPVAAAPNYMSNNAELKNFYFSHIAPTAINYIKFNGFRVTLS